jgi:hypothetical protein
MKEVNKAALASPEFVQNIFGLNKMINETLELYQLCGPVDAE